MRIYFIGLFLVILLLGCTEGSKETTVQKKTSSQVQKSDDARGPHKLEGDAPSLQEISFHRDESFGSTKEVVVGKVATFDVDGQNRVFIADMDQTTVHVFNPDGSYKTSLGRQGSGPAEFQAVTPKTTMAIYSNKLYITDYSGGGNFFPSRAQVFNLADLSFSYTLKLIPTNKNSYSQLDGYFPSRLYPRTSDNFLVSYQRPPNKYQDSTSYIRYFELSQEGSIIDGPILEQKDLSYLTHDVMNVSMPYTAIRSFSFSEKSLLAVTDSDSLFTARSMDFKINILDPNGRKVRSFQHSFNNVPLKRDKLLEQYNKIDMSDIGEGVGIDMIREADDLPDKWPALDRMFFDDQNRLWVATIVSNFEVYEWWILDKYGKVITKFKWPRDKLIKKVKNGYLYTQEKDDKSVSFIVKYKFNLSVK